MTLLLLDTTFLIDAERSDAQLDQAIGDDDDVAIAAITVAELQVGARLATGRRRTQRQRFVDDVCDVIPILSYDRSVAANTPNCSSPYVRPAAHAVPTTSSLLRQHAHRSAPS